MAISTESGFVTFSVPSANLADAGNGWVNIWGGNSPFGQLNGLPEGMPAFTGLGPFVPQFH